MSDRRPVWIRNFDEEWIVIRLAAAAAVVAVIAAALAVYGWLA